MTIALVDCNAFYVRAQTLFEPWRQDMAVAVCSNNDGALVSRNDPAKALGLKMGQPVFEIRHLVERGELYIYSSNYALYQSISNRVMAILGELAPGPVFNYSIDESFFCLRGVADPEGWGRHAQAEVQRRVGMPVGVGIGPTKTLAKLANWAAKKWKAKTGCVVDLSDVSRREKLLRYAPVNEVWGIGSALTKRLQQDCKISTAWDLATADAKHLRRHLSVNVERTARELNGVPCFPFADDGPDRKQMIICSRSFGSRIQELDVLKKSVATFTATAALKLRTQRSLANCIQVFARTSPFDSVAPYNGSRIIALPYPTDDTRDLTQAALTGLMALYRDGVRYAKAGVILSQFVERGSITGDLFAPKPRENSQALMGVMDAINERQGRGTIRLARDVREGSWSMKQDYLSPSYTTSWDDLPKARC